MTRNEFQTIAFTGMKLYMDGEVRIFMGYGKCSWMGVDRDPCDKCRGYVRLDGTEGCYTNDKGMWFDLWLEDEYLEKDLFEL